MRRLHNKRQTQREIARAVVTEPEGILAPLNRRSKSERIQRMIQLVGILRALAEAEDLFSDDPWDSPKLLSLYREANKILSTCPVRWSPVVTPPPERYTFRGRARTVEEEEEVCFVRWVLTQRATGDISRIRTCRNCNRWFLAVTSHQFFCDEACRQKFHSQDPHFKERRRLYMRRFREQEGRRNRR